MSDFFDRLGSQLTDASRREFELQQTAAAGRQQERPRWRWRSRPTLGLVLAVVVGGTALAATQPWQPSLGDPRLGPAPTIAADAPPKDQLDLLAILRRNATAEDRGAATQAALGYIGGRTDEGRGSSGVHTDFIRRLASPASGRAVVLIPVKRWSPGPAYVKHDALCLFYSEPNGDGGAKSCFSTQELLDGQATGSLGNQLFGLVPDGVDSVAVSFEHAQMVTASISDNFYELTAPAGTDPELVPDRTKAITWLDSAGDPVGPPLATR